MAKKVKFISTSTGDYGIAHAGDELVVTDRVADSLEKTGTVKITGSAGDDKVTTVDKGSIRIADLTNQSAPPAGETNEKNPTGKDIPAAKATPLKSASKKSGKK